MSKDLWYVKGIVVSKVTQTPGRESAPAGAGVLGARRPGPENFWGELAELAGRGPPHRPPQHKGATLRRGAGSTVERNCYPGAGDSQHEKTCWGSPGLRNFWLVVLDDLEVPALTRVRVHVVQEY